MIQWKLLMDFDYHAGSIQRIEDDTSWAHIIFSLQTIFIHKIFDINSDVPTPMGLEYNFTTQKKTQYTLNVWISRTSLV